VDVCGDEGVGGVEGGGDLWAREGGAVAVDVGVGGDGGRGGGELLGEDDTARMKSRVLETIEERLC
jgi:hypothetical protein